MCLNSIVWGLLHRGDANVNSVLIFAVQPLPIFLCLWKSASQFADTVTDVRRNDDRSLCRSSVCSRSRQSRRLKAGRDHPACGGDVLGGKI